MANQRNLAAVSDGSIVFDQAAEYYDATRSLSPETMRELVPLLAREVDGPTLEIGVGTGRIALPLAEGGAEIFGIDLSVPMMRKMREKDLGGRVPLAVSDARRLPFPPATFTTAVAAHVFHLIPEWEVVIDELIRVVRPGGRLLVSGLGEPSVPWEEVREQARRIVGGRGLRTGAERLGEVEAKLRDRAARVRPLPTVIDRTPLRPEDFIDRVERNCYSFTWSMSEAELHQVAARLREWAVDRYGSLDHVVTNEYKVVWHAYELP